ncbi:hypothetical protein [Halorientalis regularis]|uniref:Uncharacterized protein n=1 Tax=Halorientalis regularis TaxID=660518 RepID=A0A1G7GEI3_9EURY|nr:hypothetical protein [Halorientalis regularis]SDE86534.1 hypothetical protein SAMN05216218_1026 [Halorientalis regularis]
MVREDLRSHPKYESCHHCKEAFENISLHWQTDGYCDHPSYNPGQKATITGMLLYKGVLTPDDNRRNNSLVCFFENEDVANTLFDFFDDLALKVRYVDSKEYYGDHIRRKYALFLKSHPYLTLRKENWGAGRDKSVPEPGSIDDVSVTTFKFLYSIVGEWGFDGHGWPVFDCTRCDVTPHHLRGILSRYDPFVDQSNFNSVVLRNAEQFFDDLSMVSVDF